MLKRFFAWIGSLMRRRHFIATRAVVPPPPPPPPPPSAYLFSRLVPVLFEDF
jgi:hypothetical protein